jgi:hypothetical protein
MRIVQIVRDGERRVALVEGELLRLLAPDTPTAFGLTLEALKRRAALSTVVREQCGEQTIDYDAAYQSQSEWRLLPAFDYPHEPTRCLVSGTGLTHRASAENRTAMHQTPAAQMTDSMRMYQIGLEGGRPAEGAVGAQPEWFYKGRGRILRAHGEELDVPEYGLDGGEEPEVAGIYVVSDTGVPYRVGFAIGNEFSDHRMEKQNYLYLAPSKLRSCAIGPELSVGDFDFGDLAGRVTVVRAGEPLWSKEIRSGEQNMCHSLANLEHHHFKYEEHRTAGDAHVHFFGAGAFSFGAGISLEDGDVMEVAFPALGRPLRNILRVRKGPERLLAVKAL